MSKTDRSSLCCSAVMSAHRGFRSAASEEQTLRNQSEPTARDLLSDPLACVAGDTLPERVVLAARTNLTICHCERSL